MILRAENVTRMLQAIQSGDRQCVDELMSAVYDDLKMVARHYMASERASHTLQPTAIINEVFLRMFRHVDGSHQWEPVSLDWESRAHFLGIAAKQMRQVLIDRARQKQALKRDFGIRVDLTGLDLRSSAVPPTEERFLVVNELLEILALKDPDAARVVELKFFGGLTDVEAAHVMGINVAKLRRDWAFARAWLRQRMQIDRAAGQS
jgi:RNA polymerase sigma factor (TIGR02999 family)